MPANDLAADLIRRLTRWSVPRVRSERELDAAVRDFVRAEVARHIPAREAADIKRWVAGHGERALGHWTASKPYQSVCLWGASKTADLFVYHPDSAHGLPARGISLEIKYVGSGSSYAGAIATVAGQLLAYALRHEQTIGFVYIDQARRHRIPVNEARVDRAKAFLEALPSNATMIVRFSSEPLPSGSTRDLR